MDNESGNSVTLEVRIDSYYRADKLSVKIGTNEATGFVPSGAHFSKLYERQEILISYLMANLRL